MVFLLYLFGEKTADIYIDMSFFSDIKQNFERQGRLTQLIIINIAVFVTVNLVGNLSHLSLVEYTAMPLGLEYFLPRFWTLFTYMFTHVDLMHLFWNLLNFYFMAQVFFTLFNEKQMLYVYIMSGLVGGALVLVFALLFPVAFAGAYLLGASAAVLGVGAVMAIYAPNYRIFLFGVFEMRYGVFYFLIFVITSLLDLRENTGGKIAHIGGAAFGLLYGYFLKNGNDLLKFSFLPKKKTKLKVVSRQTEYKPHAPFDAVNDEERMNALLDKIAKSGYESLSKKEKDELFKLSQKK